MFCPVQNAVVTDYNIPRIKIMDPHWTPVAERQEGFQNLLEVHLHSNGRISTLQNQQPADIKSRKWLID